MARARKSNLVGLNIEPGRIAAAQVAVNGAITVEHGAQAELDISVIRDGEVTDIDALASALRTMWSENKSLDKRVRIGVANTRIVVRTIDLPPVEDPKQLDAAVRFQAGQEIPMPLETAVIDYHLIGLVETPDGIRQRAILVAARKDMIEATVRAARDAGLRPEGIDLSAFGMLRALKREDSAEACQLYVSVGGLTNLAVSDKGICTFTRVAGSGLEGIAIELAERRVLTLEHARMWLQHVGLEAELEDIDGDAEIIADARLVLREGARRIAGEIRQSLDFHHGQITTGAGVQGIVLTGPAVGVAGFGAALGEELGMEVEERVVSGHDTEYEPHEAGCLSVAAGLAVEEVAA